MLTPEQLERARQIAALAPPLEPWQRDLISRIFARRLTASEPQAA